MKRLLVLAAILLLMNGCTPAAELVGTSSVSDEDSSASAPPFEEEALPPLPIEMKTPVVLSQYSFWGWGINDEHREVILYLEMIEGEYDSTLSFWNNTWRGLFQFRVRFGSEHSDSAAEVVSGPYSLAFGNPFDLTVADYNDDGDPDFAFGQWGSFSAGDFYAIFTLRQTGEVELLPVKGDKRAHASWFGMINANDETDADHFFIPYSHEISPLLHKTEDGFYTEYPPVRGFEAVFTDEFLVADWFEANYPDNMFNCDIRDYYVWMDGHFQLTHQEILPRE